MSSTQEKVAEWKRRRKLVEITCANCGEQFRAAKYLDQTYCSRDCSNKARTDEIKQPQKAAVSDYNKKRWAEDEEYREKMLNGVNGKTVNNANWKGDDVTYSAKHTWIRNNHGPARVCENCGIKSAKRYEWANLSGNYRREVSDYMQLCKQCHMGLDRSRPIWTALIDSAKREGFLEGQLESLGKVTKENFMYRCLYGELPLDYKGVDLLEAYKSYLENDSFRENFARYVEQVAVELEQSEESE